MLSRNAALLFITSLVSLVLLFFMALYTYDPMAIFHFPFSRELTLSDNSRKQNISLIRHLQFDSVIIGNSYTANSSAKEAEDVFGGKFINISMDGAGLYEQSFALSYVLRHHKIKTVFGILSESAGRAGHGNYPLSEWAFLYDDNRFNDFKVYLNRHYLRCLVKWSNSPECVGRQAEMDRPSAWFENPGNALRFGGLDNWILHHENKQLKGLLHKALPQNAALPPLQREKDIDLEVAMEIRTAIDDFIVQPAKEYPETNFVYFFNPFSLLGRALAARGNGLAIHTFWVKETTRRCAGLNNVRLYFFDNESFTDDIKYYKDLGHYSPDINSLILQSIRLNKNRLTPDNVDEQLRLLAKRAAAYDIKAINAYVQEGLRRMDVDAASKN